MSAYYTYTLDAEEAFETTRTGILRFNVSVGVENTDHSGYHETLTRFWSQIIRAFVRSGNFGSAFVAARDAVCAYGNNRDLHRQLHAVATTTTKG